MFQPVPAWAGLAAILVCICEHVAVEAGSQSIYMTNYCSTTVPVDGSLLLDLTPPDSLDAERNGDFLHCDVDILAPRNMRLLTHVQRLGISSVSDHSDRLHLYEGSPGQTRLTPIKGLYGRLDTSLPILTTSGRNVKDYRTLGNKLKVDYLGKPTTRTPGFRLVITAFQDPTAAGKCPPKYYHCRRASVCVMRHVVCDGNPNCGKDDDDDERECHSKDTVTNLLAEYSLTRDIIVVILLPVVTFLAAVTAVYLAARQYIRHRIDIREISAVHFTAKKDGHVDIAHNTGQYNPPTYQDIMDMCSGYEPPPTYNQLATSLTRCDSSATGCDRSVGISNGRHVLKSEVRKLSRECGLCGCVTHDFRISVIPEEDERRHRGDRLHSVSDSGDNEEFKTGRGKRGKGKVKNTIKDNENANCINETKAVDFREDNQNSFVASCVVCCCSDQFHSQEGNASTRINCVTPYCTGDLACSNSTQPREKCYSRCSNPAKPHVESYIPCLNFTQPQEASYCYLEDSTSTRE